MKFHRAIERIKGLATRIPLVVSLLERRSDRSSSILKTVLEQQLKSLKIHDEPTFFVVLVPGCLHIARKSLGLIPKCVQVVLILNGMSKFEVKWVTDYMQKYEMVSVKQMLLHHAIIDCLLQSLESPFGILDYDCFVFRGECFKEIAALPNNTVMQGFFAYKNEILDLYFPETFFLYFNTKLLRDLCSKYNVGAERIHWEDLPIRVRNALKKIGFCAERLPEEHKANFDTLRVLMALSLVEDIPYKLIKNYECEARFHGDIVHIGGVSHPNYFKSSWKFMGSYFWRRLLQNETELSLRTFYSEQYGALTSEQLLANNSEFTAGFTESDFKKVDDFVSRITSKQQSRPLLNNT